MNMLEALQEQFELVEQRSDGILVTEEYIWETSRTPEHLENDIYDTAKAAGIEIKVLWSEDDKCFNITFPGAKIRRNQRRCLLALLT